MKVFEVTDGLNKCDRATLIKIIQRINEVCGLPAYLICEMELLNLKCRDIAKEARGIAGRQENV